MKVTVRQVGCHAGVTSVTIGDTATYRHEHLEGQPDTIADEVMELVAEEEPSDLDDPQVSEAATKDLHDRGIY